MPRKPKPAISADAGLAPVEGRPVRMQLDLVKITADGRRIDLGTVAYWHRNPLRRLLWRLSRLFFRTRELPAYPPETGDAA